MELYELEKEILKKDSWMFSKLAEQKSLIKRAAETEETYRIALASMILTLKSQGHPATLILDLAKGDRNIAKLKLERDIAEGIADACRQSIFAIQASISGLQSLISTRKAEMTLK